MNYSNLNVVTEENVSIITISRPKQLNALNSETLKELNTALKFLIEDNVTRVIIITGEGEKAFVAGADIKEFENFSKEEGFQLANMGQDTVFNVIENSKKPIIAAINGYALGGGLELALACHFRTASENALMGQPEVTLGLIPGYGGTQRLQNIVGKGIASEMIFSATPINSDKAINIGLVNHVFSQENLLTETKNIALKISKNSPHAISKAIESINSFNSENLKKGLAKEIKNFGDCFATKDFKEGVSAFVGKRKPIF